MTEHGIAYAIGYYGFLTVAAVLIVAGLIGWGMRLATVIVRGATWVLGRFK